MWVDRYATLRRDAVIIHKGEVPRDRSKNALKDELFPTSTYMVELFNQSTEILLGDLQTCFQGDGVRKHKYLQYHTWVVVMKAWYSCW